MKAALLAAWLAAACAGQEASGPRILRPTDHSVVEAGPLSIVAKGGSLKLDGKAIAATSPGPGALTATVTPSAGLHKLEADDAAIQFFVGAGAPTGWQEFKTHPPGGAACNTCHAVIRGAWEIKGGVTGDNCFQCHNQEAFPKVHTHKPEVLIDCQLCHSPHGSTVKAHLKMAKDAACKQCHD
ncbi:MAG TPA: cytochrome c3 family protein [Bryobacteraceae bacterium]|nr:cytochrome c3 family protein [Bryobacteraceae bacterium]